MAKHSKGEITVLNIAITFDYELFLGKNYIAEEEVLFAPTNKIATLLNETGVKATFFADVCSVFQHKKYNQLSYVKGFEEQIKELTAQGHDVQLHIHSNWLKSTYDNGWNISFSGYKIHEFGFDEADALSARTIIKDGKDYLENTLKSVDPTYQTIAFRAGGFCICPETEVVQALLDNEILIDSSVALKQKAVASAQDYDFSNAPNCLDWWFSKDKGLFFQTDENDGDMLEVAIGYGRNSIFKFLGIPLNELHVNSRKGAGTGIEIPGYSQTKLQHIFKSLKRRIFSNGILSLDSRGYKVLLRDVDYLYKHFRCNEEDHNVCIICHPKLASQDTIDNMERFIDAIQCNNHKYAFTTMREIYRRKEHE